MGYSSSSPPPLAYSVLTGKATMEEHVCGPSHSNGESHRFLILTPHGVCDCLVPVLDSGYRAQSGIMAGSRGISFMHGHGCLARQPWG